MQLKKKIFAFILIVSFLIPITSNILITVAEDHTVRYLHLTWQNDPKTTMTMSWKTDVSTASIVQYGLDNTYGNQVDGISGLWHHVEITGLTPDTFYHYRVGDGTNWNNDNTFKTGTAGNSAQFLGFGDSQSSTPARYEVINAMDPITVDFSLYSGDFVEMSSEITEWYDWFQSFAKMTKDTPFMTTMGNHEKNHSYYYEFFALPGVEEYYSFDYGPIHFSVLHTYWEGFEDAGGDYDNQAAWLISDLEANDEASWYVVMMHRPPFSSYPRNYEESDWYYLINQTFVPIFEAYNVDVVLMGHEHGYERLEKNDVAYIISGGAGSRLYNIVPEQRLNESIYIEATYNFVFFEASDTKFHTRAYRKDYSFIDQFVANKENKVDLSYESLPLTYSKYQNETFEMSLVITNTGEENITTTTQLKMVDFDGDHFFDIPPLDINEYHTINLSFDAPAVGNYYVEFYLDANSDLDEVSEENNKLVITLNAEEIPSKTSYSITLYMLMTFLAVLAIPVIKRRRKNN